MTSKSIEQFRLASSIAPHSRSAELWLSAVEDIFPNTRGGTSRLVGGAGNVAHNSILQLALTRENLTGVNNVRKPYIAAIDEAMALLDRKVIRHLDIQLDSSMLESSSVEWPSCAQM
jgi:hypothetical protein